MSRDIVLTVLLFFGLSGRSLFAQSGGASQFFEPANQIAITVVPSISYNPSSGTFIYQFSISNAASSAQLLTAISMAVGDRSLRNGGTVSQVMSGVGWDDTLSVSSEIGGSAASWYATSPTQQSVDGLFQPPSSAVPPGRSLTGFGIISQFLPGSTTFYAQGWVSPARQDELLNYVNGQLGTNYNSPDNVPIASLRQVYPDARPITQNSYQGMTIGPVQVVSGLGLIDLIARLESLKHQSVSQGWLSGKESIEELDEKLDQAKKALAKNKPSEARHKLREFIHRLEDQRKEQLERHRDDHDDKDSQGEDRRGQRTFMNDNAFYLLKPNAEFILSKLPIPPGGREDEGSDRDDHDHR